MNRFTRYGLTAALLGLVLYNSVYFRKLSEVNAAGRSSGESAQQYAQTFWRTQLVPSASRLAVPADSLFAQLRTDSDQAFAAHAHALGIGNIGYFLVRGTGTVTAIDENEIAVALPSGQAVYLATEYIFGNAARDASGLIPGTQFDNTADLNTVSAELNDLIRKAVLPSLKQKARLGQPLRFVGALELNRAHLRLQRPILIPIQIL